ncbi:MAG: integrase core domain-containing protein [Gemmatimonadota bacterium]
MLAAGFESRHVASWSCRRERADPSGGAARPPQRVVCDNWAEFVGRTLAVAVAEHGVTLQHIQPGNPNWNAFNESLNSRVRDGRHESALVRLARQPQLTTAAYQNEYRTARRLGALEYRTPAKLDGSITLIHRAFPRSQNHGSEIREPSSV